MQVKYSPKVFEKLLSNELRNLNKDLVSKRKNLKELLKEEKPSSITKNKEEYFFAQKELEKIARVIPSYEHQDLKIPIFLYRDINLDSFYVEGKLEEEVVKKLLKFNVKAIKEKFYVPKPLAYKILREFKTTMQIVWMF